MMRKHRFFITATGTGLGKTFLTCALLEAAKAENMRCHAVKPVISGFIPEESLQSDAGRIIQSLGLSHDDGTLNSISPWRYRAPFSPDLAAKREGETIDFNDLIEFCSQSAERQVDLFLIEGVGGAMVPLDSKHTVLDWIDALDIPAVVVAGSYLGSISHTLCTLNALYTRRIQVKAVIVNESEETTVPVDDTVDSLKNFIKQIPIFTLRRAPKHHTEDIGLSQIFDFLLKDVVVKEYS